MFTSSIRRPDSDVVDQKIHNNNLINSILAKIQATAAGADDAIMLDSRGFVAEVNATHLFVVKNGVVNTPRAVACPEGITRLNVLRLCEDHQIPYDERDISLAELYMADEIFCTGTMGELAPVVEIDGRMIGEVGAVYEKLGDLFRDLTNIEGTVVV